MTKDGSRQLVEERQKRRGVVLPVCFVEVGGKEVARLVQEQCIDASHERLAVLILAREVAANDVLGHRQEPATHQPDGSRSNPTL